MQDVNTAAGTGPAIGPAEVRETAPALVSLCGAAGLPLFWQLAGFGDTRGSQFDFLRKLDEPAVPDKRTADNTGYFHACLDPRTVPESELYDRLVAEFPLRLTAAGDRGVIR